MTRRTRQLPILAGILAWTILALVPAFHAHAPESPGADGPFQWSCALCAVSQVVELDGIRTGPVEPGVCWIAPSAEKLVTLEAFAATHDSRAPPLPLT